MLSEIFRRPGHVCFFAVKSFELHAPGLVELLSVVTGHQPGPRQLRRGRAVKARNSLLVVNFLTLGKLRDSATFAVLIPKYHYQSH